MKAFALGSRLDVATVEAAARGRLRIVLDASGRARMERSRAALSRLLRSGRVIYGVNTGFGELASKRIGPEEQRALQRNLVRSHACGVGEPLGGPQVRAMLFLRANELARGFSGCRPAVAERMAALLERGVVPLVPSRGSVGASGDLAPQAHAALVLLGEGEAFYRGRRLSGARALSAAGIEPLALEAKEGISLINGTQAMQALGALALTRARRVVSAADLAGAMSLEALKGTPDAFDARLMRLKPHPGQARSAARLRRLLRLSEIRESHRRGDSRVQDPYCLRCMPQVHGACADAIDWATRVLETELNSVTDNPALIGGRAFSGGNFHGQAPAFALDQAALALCSLAGISERRVFQLMGSPLLPPFLAERPGLESGYMIAQVAAAALASESKSLAQPASADSIPTSAGKEDFVSMGMGAALKCERAVWNAAQVLGVELLCAARGLERHRPLRPGAGVAEALRRLRAAVRDVRGDEPLSARMEAARELILEGAFEAIA